MKNRFDDAPLPIFSALMASVFGSDEQAAEADEYLREQGMRD